MRRILGAMLLMALFFGGAGKAGAVDFRMSGEAVFGAGALSSAFIVKKNGQNTNASTDDKFQALQRYRLQLETIASENLSSLLCIEIGDNLWGSDDAWGKGAALGADRGDLLKVRHAFMDWRVPHSDLSLRMGLQTVPVPHAAGGSQIHNNEAAAIVANYRFSENVGLSGLWLRPYNDNYTPITDGGANYQDNADMFMLSAPITVEGLRVTPWVMAGAVGKNVFKGDERQKNFKGSIMYLNLMPYSYLRAEQNGNMGRRFEDRAYGALFFTGLPLVVEAFEPWHFEVDFNYGWSQGLGRYEITDYRDHITRRADTRREGWMAKALVEYSMDWGVPGLFGWYASGDDGNVKNGSERMPALSPCGNFTSFVGDDPTGFGMLVSGNSATYDLQLNYAGTWGLGIQFRDVSFMEDLKHTLRVARWGGTNSPNMVKYLASTDAGEVRMNYLTQKDAMIEFNLDSVYQIYENLSAHIQLGYVLNMVDLDHWNKAHNDKLQKADAYKASAMLYYKF